MPQHIRTPDGPQLIAARVESQVIVVAAATSLAYIPVPSSVRL